MMEEYDFMSVVMYPDLKNRREFIHDCWMISKAKENDELKIAVTLDTFFYLTRDDLLILLKTHDNSMITHVLKNECKHHILEDIGYKLIQVKGQQVDKNQHTPVQLLDFISVMIENKRDDNLDLNSEIIFSHNYILKFLEYHKLYVKEDQVVKILILAKKFRLSLQFIQTTKMAFHIDFFTNAIEANAYDIAFYLLNIYEEQIFQSSQKAIDTHVNSYKLNKQFLKSKLHMTKCLMPILNFKSAKVFLDIIFLQINDTLLEGNFYTHSCNPLLNMCLLYELLTNVIKKFFSLNNMCRTIMKTTMEMAV